jgi:hypothetical protein
MEPPTDNTGPDESDPLFDRHEQEYGEVQDDSVVLSTATNIIPFALLASLAIAVTSATTVFAYASLICRDPTHCQNAESSDYAAAVAVATFLANLAGTFALGPLGRLITKYRLGALWVWIICRASSVAVLALGGMYWNHTQICRYGLNYVWQYTLAPSRLRYAPVYSKVWHRTICFTSISTQCMHKFQTEALSRVLWELLSLCT